MIEVHIPCGEHRADFNVYQGFEFTNSYAGYDEAPPYYVEPTGTRRIFTLAGDTRRWLEDRKVKYELDWHKRDPQALNPEGGWTVRFKDEDRNLALIFKLTFGGS